MSTGPLEYEIVFTEDAAEMLNCISDAKLRKKIAKKIDELAFHPDLKGKPLREDLMGLYSERCGGRYRVIFSIQEAPPVVTIVVIGIRKEGDRNNAYEIAKKLRDRGDI